MSAVIKMNYLWAKLNLRNVVSKKVYCNCPYHRGTEVAQVEADLPNGTHFVVMEDNRGYHFAIGEWDDDVPPPVIAPEEIEIRLLEAMR
jgi:hypothetical protein